MATENTLKITFSDFVLLLSQKFFMIFLLLDVVNSFLRTKNHYNKIHFDTHRFDINNSNLIDNPFKYSGFIEVNKTTQAFMYYMFFPSYNGMNNSSSILWLQGGPGCGDQTGLFEEIGPFYVNPNTFQLEKREFSWIEEYNLLFVDQPCGAGFSYVKVPGGYVKSLEEASNELYNFLIQWFGMKEFSILKKNGFFIFGESYGGKFAPAIAHRIMKESFKLPLNGVVIGDGASQPSIQMTDYTPFLEANSLLGKRDIEFVKKLETEIIEFIKREEWKNAIERVEYMHDYITINAGNVSIYDIRIYEEYDFSATEKFLNFNEVKKMMHTEGIEYSGCSNDVYQSLHEDMMKSTAVPMIIELLNRNISVTFYNGQFDLIVFAEGTKKMIDSFEWKFKNEFNNAKRNIWKLSNGEILGYVREYMNLRYVVIPSAGHMAPLTQPQRLFELVKIINH